MEKAKAIRTTSKNIGVIIDKLQSVADNVSDEKCEKYISANSAATRFLAIYLHM